MIAGKAHIEERRLVLCRHAVGDPDVLRPEAVCGDDQ